MPCNLCRDVRLNVPVTCSGLVKRHAYRRPQWQRRTPLQIMGCIKFCVYTYSVRYPCGFDLYVPVTCSGLVKRHAYCRPQRKRRMPLQIIGYIKFCVYTYSVRYPRGFDLYVPMTCSGLVKRHAYSSTCSIPILIILVTWSSDRE